MTQPRGFLDQLFQLVGAQLLSLQLAEEFATVPNSFGAVMEIKAALLDDEDFGDSEIAVDVDEHVLGQCGSGSIRRSTFCSAGEGGP